ncbi:iron-sulfur cluster carrier protein ApbC [Paraglaciecola arctica]|uniref:Iron-sulfur cluster carrier protein n=1 Tax=Paraglaciecola arctica BSs20135 TaxID=493475 RepID=K6XHJ5_9ALTE|nr:iron-sulfur cluster carrier protein ApbC [Paraglaciecola arctica]GAC20139.1 ATP-binding protein involved in chromosome partitioning [Paraglaciecola arctica BSs20135]
MSDIIAKLAALLQQHIPVYFSDIQRTSDYIKVEGKSLSLSLPFVCNSLLGAKGEFSHLLESFAKQHKVNIKIAYDIPSIKGQNPKVVKNVIAVASGKGGVGKSTTSINLAAALSLEGARVGILDADVYGPSLPTLLGTKNVQPESPDNKNIYPIIVNDLQTMSIGYLVDEDSATVWRGPMASRAFQQLYNETLWDELDYLIVDMPPGTGDIQLTLAQNMPVTAAVIVTTPQDLALADAIKGISMFNKVDINVLGIVENMSYHICTECGHKEHIFGADGGQRIAHKYQTELLAQLPLNMQIRELADSGTPFMYNQEANPEIQQIYRTLALKLSYKLSQQKMAVQQIAISAVK